jgi:hypothetical protein
MATRSWVLLGNGFWDGTTNWTGNVLPSASDDALIDVAGDITVTHRSDTTVINSLISREALVIFGGSFGVSSQDSNLKCINLAQNRCQPLRPLPKLRTPYALVAVNLVTACESSDRSRITRDFEQMIHFTLELAVPNVIGA